MSYPISIPLYCVPFSHQEFDILEEEFLFLMIRFLTLAGQSPQNYATENINKDVNFKDM